MALSITNPHPNASHEGGSGTADTRTVPLISTWSSNSVDGRSAMRRASNEPLLSGTPTPQVGWATLVAQAWLSKASKPKPIKPAWLAKEANS
jgi:hypothetical protein